jgi:hypothetical protein
VEDKEGKGRKKDKEDKERKGKERKNADDDGQRSRGVLQFFGCSARL